MRISDWSSDVCSSDLRQVAGQSSEPLQARRLSCFLCLRCISCRTRASARRYSLVHSTRGEWSPAPQPHSFGHGARPKICSQSERLPNQVVRSEEHTSELQSLMRTSSAVFCSKKKKQQID